MRKSSVYKFNLPEANDFYNVDNFNENFNIIESVLINSGVVTGIMTANGTMTLGFQPKAVFVIGSSGGIGSDTGARSWARSIAFALPNSPWYSISNANSAEAIQLEITATGFRTIDLAGSASTTGGNLPTAARPLRYIAFR